MPGMMGNINPNQKGNGLLIANQGPSTPVRYDEHMKQFVPYGGAGRPGEVRLKYPPKQA